MAAELNDISVAIGALQANHQQVAQQQDRILGALRELKDTLALVPLTAARLDRVEPLVDEHERLRQNGRGVIAGFSLVAGGMGAGVVEFGRMLLQKIGS